MLFNFFRALRSFFRQKQPQDYYYNKRDKAAASGPSTTFGDLRIMKKKRSDKNPTEIGDLRIMKKNNLDDLRIMRRSDNNNYYYVNNEEDIDGDPLVDQFENLMIL